jgi:hypothetical protein
VGVSGSPEASIFLRVLAALPDGCRLETAPFPSVASGASHHLCPYRLRSSPLRGATQRKSLPILLSPSFSLWGLWARQEYNGLVLIYFVQCKSCEAGIELDRKRLGEDVRFFSGAFNQVLDCPACMSAHLYGQGDIMARQEVA